MAAGTNKIGIDATKFWPVPVDMACQEVEVFENNLGITASFQIAAPSANDISIDLPAGQVFKFHPPNGEKFFKPSQVAGWIKPSGSILLGMVYR